MAVILSSFCLTGLVIIVIVYLVLHYLRKMRLYVESAKFPGPVAYPFIGSAHYFMGSTQDILSKCQELLDTYPSPFCLWLGSKLFYAIYEPEQLKAVLLSQKTIEKEELYKFVEPWMGTGLFTAPASKWRIHRKLIMPTFNQRILDSFVEVFSTKSEVLVNEMEVEVDGQEFDVFNYMSLCTLDIICETAMGVSSHALTQRTSPYVDAVKRLLEIIYSRMFKIWLHPAIIFNQTKLGKDQDELIKFVHSVTDNVIQRKRQEIKSNEKHRDYKEQYRKAFLDLLMELSHEGKKFTDEELREEVDTMMIAGNDTSATVMSFAILMLAIHPDVQTKVFEELCDIYGSEDPCAIPIKQEDLHRMEYLERVIKETMRLFPVGPLIFRRVTEDLNIGKYTLTKGSSVVIAIIKTHRSEEYWTEPLKFNPDRFLPEELAKRHPYTYIPFSAGPRNCIGVKYAMMAMKTMLAALVRKFVLKKDKPLSIEEIKIKADIIIKPAFPITVKIERRIYTKI